MIKKLGKFLIIVILFVFTASYVVGETGYYEYTARQNMVITSDKIKEFEEDIKNNENIDVKDYLNKDKVSYSNKITNLVYNISDSSNKIAKKTIKYIFKKIGSLIDE